MEAENDNATFAPGSRRSRGVVVMGAAAEKFVILSLEELEAFGEKCALRALAARKAEDVLLSHEEAARQLGITPNALHKRVHRGLIVPDQRGGRDGFKTNGFTQSTIDAYKRKHSKNA